MGTRAWTFPSRSMSAIACLGQSTLAIKRATVNRRMNRSLVCLAGAVILLCSATPAQDEGRQAYYSTCPDFQHSVIRSVLYIEVPEADLLRWAKAKPHPKPSTQPQALHVRVQVEGEGVFCAQALDGPPDKQKTAVESAMRWRFKKNRGDFKSNLMGTLTFRF